MKIKNLKYSLAILGMAATFTLTGCGEKEKINIGHSQIKYYDNQITGSASYDEIVRYVKIVTFESNNVVYNRLLIKNTFMTHTLYHDLKTGAYLIGYYKDSNGITKYDIGEKINIIDEKELSPYLLEKDFIKTDYEIEELVDFFDEIQPSLATSNETVESSIVTEKEEEELTIVKDNVDNYEDAIPYEDVQGIVISASSDGKITLDLTDEHDDKIDIISIDDEEFRKILSKFHNVENIDIRDGRIDSLKSNNYDFLNDLPNPEKIECLTFQFYDGTNLECLANFKNLKELYLYCNTHYSNTLIYISQDISQLTHLNNLEKLAITNSDLDDISFLSNFPNLNWLCLNENMISNISPLENLTNLNCLRLMDNNITDISPLSNLTNLQYLNLANNSISDISPLSNLKNLYYLELTSNQIADISPLANLTHLQDIYFSNNYISDISPLSNLTNLQCLVLGLNSISDISSLSDLKDLEFLYLAINHISDVSSLSNLKDLEFLCLGNNCISDVSSLSNLKNLKYLNLESNDISDISSLADLEIEELVLDENPIATDQFESNDDSNKKYSLK